MTATKHRAATADRTPTGRNPAELVVAPFPPIESYAFLSDCHTGALIARDGSVEWLCVPSFDSPSIFGSLLDREAGRFRFGPYGIDHPTARVRTSPAPTCWRRPTARRRAG